MIPFSDVSTAGLLRQIYAARFNRVANGLKQFVGRMLDNNISTTDKSDAANCVPPTGKVYLVGAGPGDPELLTIKAWKLLQQADVVLYDALVGDGILQMIPKHTARQFVGKRCHRHHMAQQEICRLMVSLAMQGKRVVRLKGGDPAIFARSAEELAYLNQCRVPCALVPGITAASGAAASSGILLTHRQHAQSVRFITGQYQCSDMQPNWGELVMASRRETLVFYMGLGKLATITGQLAEHGMSADMPVAIIDQATTAEQKICVTRLTKAASDGEVASFKGPALIIVGEVAGCRYQVHSTLSAIGHEV